jgi:hypothetical protein
VNSREQFVMISESIAKTFFTAKAEKNAKKFMKISKA